MLISKQWIENAIGTEGAYYLCEGLKNNTTLASLDLGGIHSLMCCCIKYLWHLIKCKKMIGNRIEREAVKIISEMLKSNNVMVSLDMSSVYDVLLYEQ